MSRSLLLFVNDEDFRNPIDLEDLRNVSDQGLLSAPPLISNRPIIFELHLTSENAENFRSLFSNVGTPVAVLQNRSPANQAASVNLIGHLVARDASHEAHFEEERLVLDRAGFRVRRGGRWLRLNPMEFDLFAYFFANPDRVIPRAEFIAALWTQDRHIRERTVDVRVKRLRKALGDRGDKGLIRTHRSVGYYLSSDPEIEARAGV